MGKNKNIRYLMLREVEAQIETGTKKRDDKKRQHETTGKNKAENIHGYDSIDDYMEHVGAYGNWLRDRGMGHCTLQEAREHAGEYVNSFDSAWTQKTIRSALARVWGCDGPELCECKERRSEDIKRGRIMTDRAAAIERNHPDLVEICRGMGGRNHKEMMAVRWDDFYHKDGELYWHVAKGKGGRPRDAIVLGRARDLIEAELVRVKETNREHELVFQDRSKAPFHVPSHTNVHKYRADYAARVYEYASEHGKSSGEIYKSRTLGRSFDKGQLDYMNENLGHGHGRYHTGTVNYLSYGDPHWEG